MQNIENILFDYELHNILYEDELLTLQDLITLYVYTRDPKDLAVAQSYLLGVLDAALWLGQITPALHQKFVERYIGKDALKRFRAPMN